MSFPSDVEVREFPQNNDGKRWELIRPFRGLTRAVITAPRECTERPPLYDPAVYVSYTCPDPLVPGGICLVDVAPTESTGRANAGDSIDVLIKCSITSATTVPSRVDPTTGAG
ncbi:MAG: hypothetical protein HYX32_03525 [Actinobacteria bacterium]|nr:hypothetical protein [Actinomycetota bacterium]